MKRKNASQFKSLVAIALCGSGILLGCDRPAKRVSVNTENEITQTASSQESIADEEVAADSLLNEPETIAPKLEPVTVTADTTKDGEATTVETQNEELTEKLLTAEDVRNETREAIQAAKQFAIQREKELHFTIDQQYNAFLGELDALKKKATVMRSEAKTRVSEELQKVGSDMTQTAEKLQDIESSSSETLTNLSTELEKMLERMKTDNAQGETEDTEKTPAA